MLGSVVHAGPDRLLSAGRAGIPQIVAPGCTDLIDFAGTQDIPLAFKGRPIQVHNKLISNAFYNPEERRQIAREYNSRIGQSAAPAHLRGPVLSFWVFHILRDYAATLRDRGSPHSGQLVTLLQQAATLKQAVGPVEMVLGHNDFLPANILRADQQYWLIDWEYAGFNSPLFDLGGLASNCALSRDNETIMLQRYFGTPPDTALWRRYEAMKCASLLRETMWSMVSEITSELDFDYGEYTAENLDRYRAS